MEKTFGQYLEDTDTFYNRIGDAVCCAVVLNAVAQSKLLDILGDTPAAVGSLSDATGIPDPALQRLANFLAAHEFVDLLDDGRIAPNARTALVRDAASMIQCNIIGALAGSALYPALKQGKIPFELYYGKPVFEHLSANPELGATFGNFMGFMTRRDERFVFAHHTFEPFEVVADIGGSHGDLLLSMLERHPGTRGVLFDLPHTVAQAEAAVHASPHAERVEIVGGSFFEKVPAADLYLLKQILHDWSDEECVHILKSIRSAST